MKKVIIILLLVEMLVIGIFIFLERTETSITSTDNQNQNTASTNSASAGPVQYGECGDGICDGGENTPSYPYYCPEDCISIIDCNEDYDCLYEKILTGNPAKVVITEKVESLNIIEKSEVKIEPINNQFRVSMEIIDLKEIIEDKRKSIVGSISETCPQIINNFNKVESKSAICIVNFAEEAKQLAIDGLTEDSIKKYNCVGELIDVINDICVTPNSTDYHHSFPPGVKKPAVYLYPTKMSEIEVKVDVNGFITKAEPDYITGWKVIAEPDGIINNKYDYLFYEAQLNNLQLPKKGWIVKYSNLDKWFDKKLSLLGLNEKEITQFKEYWMKKLTEANYYEVKILEDQFLKENMDLIVNPTPDTIIRLNFYFKPHSDKIEIEKPIIKTPKRFGFTVVEWGGLLDN